MSVKKYHDEICKLKYLPMQVSIIPFHKFRDRKCSRERLYALYMLIVTKRACRIFKQVDL